MGEERGKNWQRHETRDPTDLKEENVRRSKPNVPRLRERVAKYPEVLQEEGAARSPSVRSITQILLCISNLNISNHILDKCIPGSRAPLSDIVFFYTHDILTIFQFDAIYRDILTIFSKCKLGLNAPKFHSRSAYVDIFATKLPIYGIC